MIADSIFPGRSCRRRKSGIPVEVTCCSGSTELVTLKENLKILLQALTITCCAALFAFLFPLLIGLVEVFNGASFSSIGYFRLVTGLLWLTGVGAGFVIIAIAASNPKSWLGYVAKFLYGLSLIGLGVLGSWTLIFGAIELYERSFEIFITLAGLIAFVLAFYFNSSDARAEFRVWREKDRE